MAAPASSGPGQRSILKPLIWAVVFAASVQLFTGFLVIHQIQRRLEIKITGTFWPVPLLPSFFSSNARFEWKNKVTLLSGNVKIDYNVLPWVTKNSIRVKIKGRNIKARLAGDWSKMQGVEEIEVDTFEADVDVARKGLGEIYTVRADSPSFHFGIQRN